MKDAFVLVGTIAAGKSYIGRLIENCFDIPFFEYEDIFIEAQKDHPDDFLKLAEPLAEKAILDFLDKHYSRWWHRFPALPIHPRHEQALTTR